MISQKVMTPERISEIEQRTDAATEGPWWSDESELSWRLHGVMGRIPASGSLPEQIMNKQILKAPKKGTTQAEYWPNRADGEFIVHAREDVPALLAEVRRLREVNDELNASIEEVLKERDEREELLDTFAYTVAPQAVIGEHSSGNDPWQNALDLVTPAVAVDHLESLLDCLRSGLSAIAIRAQVFEERPDRADELLKTIRTVVADLERVEAEGSR